MNYVKILNGDSDEGTALTESQVLEFLTSGKMNLYLGTIDEFQHPNIHPLWYVYKSQKLYFATDASSLKLNNAKNNSKIYFCIASEKIPYTAVRGKGTIKIVNDQNIKIELSKNLVSKYLGNFENKMAKELMDDTSNGKVSVVEITPVYFSTSSFDSYFE